MEEEWVEIKVVLISGVSIIKRGGVYRLVMISGEVVRYQNL